MTKDYIDSHMANSVMGEFSRILILDLCKNTKISRG